MQGIVILLVRAHFHILVASLDARIKDGAHALVLHLLLLLAESDGNEHSGGNDEQLHLKIYKIKTARVGHRRNNSESLQVGLKQKVTYVVESKYFKLLTEKIWRSIFEEE